MDFATACAEAAFMPDLVKEYNRLTGCNFNPAPKRSGFDLMIDKATGYSGINEEEAKKFADFFYETVWSRLPEECFAK